MGAIVSAIVSFVGAIISGLASYFARKGTVVVASIAAFIALTVSLIVALQALFNAVLSSAILPPWFAQYIGLAIPPDFVAVLSAVVAARATRMAYDIAVEKVRLVTQAN
jgi:hypothetical protein